MKARSSAKGSSLWITPNTPERLVAKGWDTERLVLARAIKLHVEKRCFLNSNKAVVFPGH